MLNLIEVEIISLMHQECYVEATHFLRNHNRDEEAVIIERKVTVNLI